MQLTLQRFDVETFHVLWAACLLFLTGATITVTASTPTITTTTIVITIITINSIIPP